MGYEKSKSMVEKLNKFDVLILQKIQYIPPHNLLQFILFG